MLVITISTAMLVACNEPTVTPQGPGRIQDIIAGFWHFPAYQYYGAGSYPDSSYIPWIIDSNYTVWTYGLVGANSFVRKVMQFRFGERDTLECFMCSPSGYYLVVDSVLSDGSIFLYLYTEGGIHYSLLLTTDHELEQNGKRIDSLDLHGIWRLDSTVTYDSLNSRIGISPDTSVIYNVNRLGLCIRPLYGVPCTTFIFIQTDSMRVFQPNLPPYMAFFRTDGQHLVIKQPFTYLTGFSEFYFRKRG